MSSTRLYTVLEIQPDATHDDIKRAYRRLALLYHPDKAGPEGAPRFQAIHGAYATLSDPKLRAVYDKYGERALEYANTPLGEVALSAGGLKRVVVIVLLLLFLWVSLLIMFLSFLAAKVDGRIAWSWPSVFSPLFAMDGILLLALIAMTPRVVEGIQQAAQEQRDNGDTMHPDGITKTAGAVQLVLVYVSSFAYVAFTIAVAVGLEHDDPRSLCWRKYLIPWYLWAIAYALGCCMAARPSRILGIFARIGLSNVSKGFVYLHGCLEVVQGFAGVVFAVLVACRIDGVITVNWFAVATPIFAAIAASLVQKCMEAYLAHTVTATMEQPGERRSPVLLVCAVLMQVLLAGGLPTATIVMILSMLEGSGVDLAQALIPIYIIVGCMVLASCCLCCGAAIAPEEMFGGAMGDGGEEAGGDEGGAQQGVHEMPATNFEPAPSQTEPVAEAVQPQATSTPTL